MSRKGAGLVLALAMLTMTSSTLATAPSKTISDMIRPLCAVSATDQALSMNVIVFPIEEVPQAAENLASIAGLVRKGAPLIQYFGPSIQDALAALLPEGFDATSLSMHEFVPIQVMGYDSAYGDVAFFFEFPTGYVHGQPLAALAGLREKAGVAWFALKAEIVEDVVKTYFPQEILENMQTDMVFLAILSGEAAPS